jgi:hypothetical protein
VRYVPHCAFNSNAALWDWDQRFMHGDFAVHCAGDLRRSARIPQLEAIRRGERSALDLALHFR